MHDEVVMKYYGCGIVVPTCLDGMHVVDLGSGSGRDCFALSKLVGERGSVGGIDMTEEQVGKGFELDRGFPKFPLWGYEYQRGQRR